MDQTEDPTPPELTAEGLRRRTRSANRRMAALLVGVSLLFLAGAFGVGAIALHGPF